MTHDPESDAATTWLRFRNPFDDESQRAIATWLLELSSDGGVLRQIGLDEEGSVRYRCGTQEYGVWNDEVAIEPYSPTSVVWSSLLGEQGGGQITAQVFEAAWDAT